MKVAVSIPDDVFEAGEKASRRLRVTRSRFYAEAVRAYAREHSGGEITRRLNEVYSSTDADEGLLDSSVEILRRERW